MERIQAHTLTRCNKADTRASLTKIQTNLTVSRQRSIEKNYLSGNMLIP